MRLRLGYYGRDRYYGYDRPSLIDHILEQTCQMLGASLVLVPDSGLVPAIDILVWYVVPPLNKKTHAWLHESFNVYLLYESWENPKKRARLAPDMVVDLGVLPDEESFVLPIDPHELALRIVTTSFRRGHALPYDFDPTFYATHRAVIDGATRMQASSDDGPASG
jgi:hypothetical protein